MSLKSAIEKLQELTKTFSDASESEPSALSVGDSLHMAVKKKAMKKAKDILDMNKAKIDEFLSPKKVKERRQERMSQKLDPKTPGVHEPMASDSEGRAMSGHSMMGRQVPKATAAAHGVQSDPKAMVRQKIQEIKGMPKPKLPKSETDQMRDSRHSFKKAKDYPKSLASQNIREHMQHVERHPGGAKQAQAIGIEQARRGEKE